MALKRPNADEHQGRYWASRSSIAETFGAGGCEFFPKTRVSMGIHPERFLGH